MTFAIRYSLFSIRYSLFAIRYSLVAIRYSLFAIRYSLCITTDTPSPLTDISLLLVLGESWLDEDIATLA